MGLDLIGRKIDYLNTNIFKEQKIIKSCIQKKCKQQKEKCVWREVYGMFINMRQFLAILWTFELLLHFDQFSSN